MSTEQFHRRLTVEEAEAEYMVSDESLGPNPVPFGTMQEQWKELVAAMRPGDEIWDFDSSEESWIHLAGRGGIGLVRDGEVIEAIILRMN